MRGRMNGDKRGNAQQRRARRVKMLSPEGGWGGNGEKVPCVRAWSDARLRRD